MKPLFKIAGVLLAVNIGTAVGSAPTDGSIPNAQALRVRLSAPSRTPLGADEIRSAMSGKSILLDKMTALAPGVILDVVLYDGCPPIEHFYADGKWERGVCGRMYTVTHGHWSIETNRSGSKLCNTVEGQDRDCRTVWQRSSPDQLILTAPSQHGGNPEYNSYRTLPL